MNTGTNGSIILSSPIGTMIISAGSVHCWNRSLSLHLKYKDFVYSMGGDTYQHAQRAVLNTFGDKVRAHIYNANHHFHGGVLQEHLTIPATHNRITYEKYTALYNTNRTDNTFFDPGIL